MKDKAKIIDQNKETIKNLIELIENSNTYDVNSYKYFVFPFKGISPMNTELLKEIINLMKLNISSDSSKLFTFMVDGLVFAVPLALETNKPLIIARDFHYHLPDTISFLQETKYFKRKMYFKGLVKSDKIEIIDAIVSSGKTILSAIDKMEKIGCEIKGIHTVVDKPDYGGSSLLKQKGYKFFSLVDVKVQDNKIVCFPSKNCRV